MVVDEPFESVRKRMTAAKAGPPAEAHALLAERYDLSDRPAADAKMFRGKAVQARRARQAACGRDLGVARAR